MSPRPVYGRILVFVRKAFYHLFVKWHARAVLQQQNSFNQSASRLLTELAQRQKRAAEEGARLEQQAAAPRAGAAASGRGRPGRAAGPIARVRRPDTAPRESGSTAG